MPTDKSETSGGSYSPFGEVLPATERERLLEARWLTEVKFFERIAADLASCLADDGDPIRLRPETKDWMEQNGYFDP